MGEIGSYIEKRYKERNRLTHGNLGNDVTVGANAVVIKNVPDNCVVVGVPAYIIRKNGLSSNGSH